MDSIGVALRRTIMLVLLAATVGAIVSWRRSAEVPTPGAEPVWPPLPDRAGQAEQPWVAPSADGVAPASHPIKVKDSSGIFHVPGGRFYDRTKPDRCYTTAAAAEADGYRRSKS